MALGTPKPQWILSNESSCVLPRNVCPLETAHPHPTALVSLFTTRVWPPSTPVDLPRYSPLADVTACPLCRFPLLTRYCPFRAYNTSQS